MELNCSMRFLFKLKFTCLFIFLKAAKNNQGNEA